MGLIPRGTNSYLGLLKTSAPEIITQEVRISTLELQEQGPFRRHCPHPQTPRALLCWAASRPCPFIWLQTSPSLLAASRGKTALRNISLTQLTTADGRVSTVQRRIEGTQEMSESGNCNTSCRHGISSCQWTDQKG